MQNNPSMQNNPDPASLQNLNGIVLPEAVGWWPPAPGWYVVIALILALALWGAWRTIHRHRANRYRRNALAELATLRSRVADPDQRPIALGQLSALLKRTALAVLPRDRIAKLSGTQWHDLLDTLVKAPLFAGETGYLLDRASYGATGEVMSDQESGQLLDAAATWLKQHDVPGA